MVAALTVSMTSLAQAADPGTEPGQRGKLRSWYTPEGLLKAAGPAAIDLTKLTGRLGAMMTHGFEHTRMSVRQGRLAFAPEYDVLQAGAGQAVLPAAVADDWSDAFTAVAGAEATGGVQAILLPTGKILVTTRAVAYTMTPPALGQPIPANLPVTPQIVPLEFPTPVTGNGVTVIDTAFCNGGTLLADGTVLLAGGTRHIFSGGTMYQLGVAQSVRYTGSSWEALPDMKGRGAYPEPTRWYPTATRLASGKVLVTGGYDTVSWGTKNLSAEVYDPATNDWTVVTPTNGLPPELFSWQYTHQFQLPFVTPGGEDVLSFGDAGVPGYMKASGSWRLSTKVRAGSLGVAGLQPNTGTTSLLPLRVNNGEWGYNNGSVIMAGGQTNSTQMNRIDVYDPKTDQWKFPRPMVVSRAHAASVVLPDARILLMGGEDYGTSAGLGRTQYVDPRTNFSVEWGTDEYPEVRGYHNVALLLPDGRVLFGSGNQNFTRGELPSYRFYSPSYMSQPRPVIQYAPASLSYGGYSWVTWEGAEAPSEIVLISLGAMTHSFDMNQRYIQLPILTSGSTSGLNYSLYGTPANSRVAPPGHYMMFTLNASRVPSQAKIVHLQ